MIDWQKELEQIVHSDSLASRAERENARFERFLREIATPALKEISEEMQKLGRRVTLREAPVSTILTVYRNERSEEICYSVTRQFVNDGILPRAQVRVVRMNSRTTSHDVPFRPDSETYTIDDVTREDVIRSFLTFYKMTKGQ